MTDDPRARFVRKRVSFTPAEWERVSARMEAAKAPSFDAFARGVLIEGRVNVVSLPFDPQTVRYELSRLGNNLNQIARAVNIEHGASVQEMRAARQIMREVQEVLSEQMRRAR